MALVVEDGTGKADAESYCSVADIATYATAHGLSFDVGDVAAAEAAARRGTTWLDAAFRARLPGYRSHGRDQALEWPRVDAGVAVDEMPREIMAACCEAAIRELAAPGGLSPDVVAGRIERHVRVEGAIDVDYAGAASVGAQRPTVTVIEDILGGLLATLSGSRELLRV